MRGCTLVVSTYAAQKGRPTSGLWVFGLSEIAKWPSCNIYDATG